MASQLKDLEALKAKLAGLPKSKILAAKESTKSKAAAQPVNNAKDVPSPSEVHEQPSATAFKENNVQTQKKVPGTEDNKAVTEEDLRKHKELILSLVLNY